MKKFLFMLMLTALTAIGANAQVTMYKSTDGYAVGTAVFDTVVGAQTKYLITPATALNAATTGKYRIAVNYIAYAGAWTGKIIIEGRIGTATADSNWVPINNVRGTDGRNCDTLQVTASSPAYGWVFNCTPGVAHVESTGATTTAQNVYWVAAGRFTQLRVKVVGATNNARITAKVLTAL